MHTRPSLHGRGCREAAWPTPLFLFVIYIHPVPGKPGFRSKVRSQAPAPANTLLPLESQPVSAKGRRCCFRCGRAGPRLGWQTGSCLRLSGAAQHSWAPCRPLLYLDTRQPPVWGASLMQHPLSQPILIWFECLLSSLLSEGPPDWVSANGQGRGSKAAG